MTLIIIKNIQSRLNSSCIWYGRIALPLRPFSVSYHVGSTARCLLQPFFLQGRQREGEAGKLYGPTDRDGFEGGISWSLVQGKKGKPQENCRDRERGKAQGSPAAAEQEEDPRLHSLHAAVRLLQRSPSLKLQPGFKVNAKLSYIHHHCSLCLHLPEQKPLEQKTKWWWRHTQSPVCGNKHQFVPVRL